MIAEPLITKQVVKKNSVIIKSALKKTTTITDHFLKMCQLECHIVMYIAGIEIESSIKLEKRLPF